MSEKKLECVASNWGLAELSVGFYANDGIWHTRLYGYLRVLTDKQVHPDFRSSEKWILCVYKSETAPEARVSVPGCKVNVMSIGKGYPAGVAVFDATKQ